MSKRYFQICPCPMWFKFTLLDCVLFYNEIEKCQVKKSLKKFSILWPMKSNFIFDYVQRKNVWHCLTSIFSVHFSLKIEKLWIWKSFKYFNTVRFEYAPWKNIWICLFPLFGFTLVIKLRNSDFQSHWNTLIYFDKENAVRFKYVPWKDVWFCFISIVYVHFRHKTENFRF